MYININTFEMYIGYIKTDMSIDLYMYDAIFPL